MDHRRINIANSYVIILYLKLGKKLPTYLWHKSKYFKMASCKFKDDKLMIETARIYFQ
jgi:hypothetical protein